MPVPAVSAGIDVEAAYFLDTLMGEFGLLWRDRPYVDLTGQSDLIVVRLCGHLVRGGRVVLHGSNSETPFATLEPRQANDAAKASGNLFAVYASDAVLIVLMQALLNRRFLSSRCASFFVGYRIVEGVALLKVSENIYQMFVANEANLCSDGYVYVLDSGCFQQAADSLSECYALSSVVPWTILKVSATMRSWLFRMGRSDGTNTVLPYSADEMRRIAGSRLAVK